MSHEKDKIPLEMAAALGLISADEYLDHFGEPRRAWPEVKDHSGGGYCAECDSFLESRGSYRKHMNRHRAPVAIDFALDRLFGPTRSLEKG